MSTADDSSSHFDGYQTFFRDAAIANMDNKEEEEPTKVEEYDSTAERIQEKGVILNL